MLAQLFDVADVLLHLLLVLHHEFPQRLVILQLAQLVEEHEESVAVVHNDEAQEYHLNILQGLIDIAVADF